MRWFVNEGSIVREIWGKADTILFIFAGASAEFALNKSVDWLYYTGKLPADPLGRLFSTVAYARQIVFSEYDDAMRAIRQIAAIHAGVERSRNARIPDSAYRDVLFMLIDYSIRSFELLERKLTWAEREELFTVFRAVGEGMGIPGLPADLRTWERMRAEHLHDNLIKSHFTMDLYKQYRKHLGWYRYYLLKNVQMQLVPGHVSTLLGLGRGRVAGLLLPVYKWSRQIGVGATLRNMLLPVDYKAQVTDLDMAVY